MKKIILGILTALLLTGCDSDGTITLTGEEIRDTEPVKVTDAFETLTNLSGSYKGVGNFNVPGVDWGENVATKGYIERYAYGNPQGTMYDSVDRKSYPAFKMSFNWVTKLNYPDGESTNAYSASFILKDNKMFVQCFNPATRENIFLLAGTVSGNRIYFDTYIDQQCEKKKLTMDVIASGSMLDVTVTGAFWRPGSIARSTLSK